MFLHNNTEKIMLKRENISKERVLIPPLFQGSHKCPATPPPSSRGRRSLAGFSWFHCLLRLCPLQACMRLIRLELLVLNEFRFILMIVVSIFLKCKFYSFV